MTFAGDPRPRELHSSSRSIRMPFDTAQAKRRRSSSLVYTEPPESLEQLSDQSALPNLNAQWVNAKGEWAMRAKMCKVSIINEELVLRGALLRIG